MEMFYVHCYFIQNNLMCPEKLEAYSLTNSF